MGCIEQPDWYELPAKEDAWFLDLSAEFMPRMTAHFVTIVCKKIRVQDWQGMAN